LLSDRTLRRLACPRDQLPLIASGSSLVCDEGHRYEIIEGIPILLREDVAHTHWHAELALQAARDGAALDDWAEPQPMHGVHRYVQQAIGATGGNMYGSLIGRLTEYPIPDFPLAPHGDETLIDIGCNWGRWSVAAARRGFHVIGIDPSLEALIPARHVCRQLGVRADFIIGDARHLPIRTSALDAAFSYSVIQHFSKRDAAVAATEIGRVLRPRGRALVQMPNTFGVRSIMQQARRGFREPTEFQVRYWSPRELRRTFTRAIGPARLSVDGFFSLNAQPAEAALLPLRYRLLVRASAALAALSRFVPPLAMVADSLYVAAERQAA
jgi:SAM-dependent methyltransferase